MAPSILRLHRLYNSLYILRRYPVVCTVQKLNISSSQYQLAKPASKGETLEEPVPYSKSKARNYKATDTFLVNMDTAWYQPLIMLGSITVFMIYFFMLREENDLDDWLKQPLEAHIVGMEEEQIKIAIRYAKESGRDYKTFQDKLDELVKMKSQQSSTSDAT